MKYCVIIFAVICGCLAGDPGHYKRWDPNWVDKRDQLCKWGGAFDNINNGCKNGGHGINVGNDGPNQAKLLSKKLYQPKSGFPEGEVFWPHDGDGNAKITRIEVTKKYSSGATADTEPGCAIIRAGGVGHKFVNIYYWGQKSHDVSMWIEIYGSCDENLVPAKGSWEGGIGCHDN